MEVGRPTTPLIARRDVIREALAIVDAEGMDGLSMRRLGMQLNVKGASLYHHFANKDEILVAVGRAVLREIEITAPTGGDIAQWLVASSIRQRRVLLRHPNTIPLIHRGYVRLTAVPIYQATLAQLAALGLGPAARRALLHAVEAFVVGDVIVSLMPDETAETEPADASTEDTDVERANDIERAADRARSATQERRFERALRTLIDGLLAAG